MCKKLSLLICLLFVLGAVSSASASAENWNWTDASPDGNSFCDPCNWKEAGSGNPGTYGVPDVDDYVLIRDYWGGETGPHIDCSVDVREMEGPGGGQPMSIGGNGINFNIGDFWNWDDTGMDPSPTTVTITEDPTVNIGNNWDIALQYGILWTLNISGNPTIRVGGNMRSR